MSDTPAPTAAPARGRLAARLAGFATVSLAAAWLAHHQFGLTLPAGSLWRVLAALLLYPLLEEWVFRAGLQHGLQKWLVRVAPLLWAGLLANLLASAAFVALHAWIQGSAALWVLLPSLVLGELWRRWGNLLLCVLAHAWFNACLMLVALP